MTKLSKSVLDQIKTSGVQPKSAWRFRAQRTAIWVLLTICFVAAAGFFGAVLGELLAADWRLAARWPGAELGLIRDAASGLWLAGFALATAGVFFFFRLTRRGYRFGAIAVLGFFALASCAAGASLLATSVPDRLHAMHAQIMPRGVSIGRFHDPDSGRMVGEIISIDRDTASFLAIDGREWELWLATQYLQLPDRTTLVFGEKIDSDIFLMLDARPLPPSVFLQDWDALPRMSQ